MNEEFKRNNNYSEVIEETKHIKIEKPWNDDTFIILLDKKDKHINKLKNIILVDYLAAVYHLNDDVLEFIFQPLSREDEVHFLSRRFEYNYEGDTFKCYFDKTSDALSLISKGFQQIKRNIWRHTTRTKRG